MRFFRSLLRLYVRPEPGVDPRPLRAVLAIAACNAVGWSAVMPYLPIYLSGEFGVTFTEVGLIFFFTIFTQFIGGPVGGTLADRVGRRATIVFVLVLRICVFATMATAILMRAPLAVIIALFLTRSLIDSAFMAPLNAVVADIAPAGRTVGSYGVVRVGQNVGWASGPLLGGLVFAILSPLVRDDLRLDGLALGVPSPDEFAAHETMVMAFGILFIVVATVMAIALLLALRFLPETRPAEARANNAVRVAGPDGKLPPREGLLTVLRDRSFLLFLLSVWPVFLLLAQMVMTLAVYTHEVVGVPEDYMALIYTLNGGLVIVLQIPWSRALERVPLLRALIPGIACFMFGFFIIGFAPMIADETGGWAGGLLWICLAMVFVTIAEITYSPTSAAFVAQIAPPHLRGRYMGLFGMTIALGFTLGPMFGGPALDHLADDPILMWGVLCGLGAVGITIMLVCGRHFSRLLETRLAEREAAAAPLLPTDPPAPPVAAAVDVHIHVAKGDDAPIAVVQDATETEPDA